MGLIGAILKGLFREITGDSRFSSEKIADARYELEDFFNFREDCNHHFEVNKASKHITVKDEDFEGGGCLRVYEFDTFDDILKVKLIEEAYLDYGKQKHSLSNGKIIEKYFEEMLLQSFAEEAREELILSSKWHQPSMFFRLEFIVYTKKNYADIISAIEIEIEKAKQVDRLVRGILDAKIEKKSLLIGDIQSILGSIELYDNGKYIKELKAILLELEDIEKTLQNDSFLVRRADFAIGRLKKLKEIVARCFPEDSIGK